MTKHHQKGKKWKTQVLYLFNNVLTFSLPIYSLPQFLSFFHGSCYLSHTYSLSTGVLLHPTGVLLQNKITVCCRHRVNPFSTHLLFLLWLTAFGLLPAEWQWRWHLPSPSPASCAAGASKQTWFQPGKQICHQCVANIQEMVNTESDNGMRWSSQDNRSKYFL
jgi:hypothetical protein